MPGITTPSTTVIQKYNEFTHEVELFLDNSGSFDGNEESRFHINPAAVLDLSIMNSFSDWVAQGTLSFMYFPDDVTPKQKLSTGQPKQTITGADENNRLLKAYQFRGDGFDLLRVRISPKRVEEKTKANALNVQNNDPMWCMSYLFSIYDIEDVDLPETRGNMALYMKCLKLYFHDVRYQILKTTNLEYSTALSPKAEFNSGFANDGVLPTGRAMLEVFNAAVADPEVWASGGAASLQFEQTEDPEDWDVGQSKLFYTSPASYSAFDDMEYLYGHHVSSIASLNEKVNDLCILSTKRSETFLELEKLSLIPLSKIFEKAGTDSPGELQLEHFFVTSYTDAEQKDNRVSFDSTPTSQYRAPITENDTSRDLKLFKYSQIVSYSFVEMSPEANSSMFCSTPVYSVDIGKRQFNIQFSNNDVMTARKLLSDSYISQLYKKGSNNEQLFLPTLHTSKKSKNVFPAFSLNGDNEIVRQKSGIHQLLYTGLFQNACVCFKTFGLTLRSPGTFIAIDKMDGCKDSDYNNKLYGQWFVVKVDHVFSAGVYMNIIYAIKIHRHDAAETQFGAVI